MTFKKINGPAHEHAGPSVGHSTENGDNWKTAVDKINENFANMAKAAADASASDMKAMKSFSDGLQAVQRTVADLAHTVANLLSKVAALEKIIQSQPEPSAAPPDTQPPSHPYPGEGSGS